MKRIFILLYILLIGNLGFCSDFNVYKLNNGQTVVIKEVHTNPIVTIDTWIKTGSINETQKNNGISHFLEHLFFKGSKDYPSGEFDRILESKGAINNAATSKDFTHYYITIPSKDFELALKIHADMLQNPLIPPVELEQERKVVLEEIAKDLNNPSNIVYNNLIKMLYTTHPYKQKVIGQEEIVSKLSRDEILEYFNNYYAPSNMITIVIGDVDTKNVINTIEQNFNCKSRKAPKNKYTKEKQLTSVARTIKYLQTKTGYMLIGFRSTDINHKDSYALDLLSVILGDGKTSVLYQNLKEKKNLAFNITAQNSTMKDDGIFYISANFTPNKYKELEENIFLEIEKIKKYGVSDDQLEIAKNIIERDTFYSRESISNIANEIGYTMVISDDIEYYDNYLSNIKTVDKNDVKRVANKYLGVDKAAISVLLPEEEETKEVKISEKTTKNQNATFINKNKDTEKYILQNGATLLITPNTTNEIIAININAKGGEFLENIAGTGKLTAKVMMRGTKNYSLQELSQVMENKGIKINPISKADAFSINVLTTKAELENTLNLLDEILNNATFTEADINFAKNESLNIIRQNRDIPLQKALEEHNTNIYAGSIYSNSTKILEKTYPKITREEIINYYNIIFNPKNINISINGDIDKSLVFEKFTNMFKTKNDNIFDYELYNIPTLKTQKTSTIIDKNTETAWIILAWQTDGYTNTKDFATLQVINSIIGSGMSSRLFKNLRDKEGLAYQLGSSFNPNIKKGSFITYIGTNQKNINTSINKILEEINKLKTETVTPQELQEAKDKIIGNYLISQETNLDKASTINWFETTGRGYDFDYANSINNVTSEDIKQVANKYFNNNFVLSIVKK